MDTEEKPKVGRPSKAEKLAKIHAEARAEFNRIWTAQEEVRKQALLERRFATVPGAQWEGPLGEQFENVPKFEVNKCRLALIRIYSEYRNNRVSVSFTPKDGVRNTQSDDLADLCAGRYRADEQDGHSQEARDNSFDEKTAGGMGAWRLRARYEDEEDEEDERQRIIEEPIFDADQCVFFDADAKLVDKSDAKKCWVLTSYTPEAYREEFGGDPATWPKDTTVSAFEWASPHRVWVAEYYAKETEKKQVRVVADVTGAERRFELEKDEDDGTESWVDCETGDVYDGAALKALGFKRKSEKTVTRQRVRKYLMDGAQILEDCGLIAGCEIPIVVEYGLRWFIDGVEHFQGHSRVAMDAQRLANMQRSALAVIASQPSVERPIFTPEQMKGHTNMWSQDSVKKWPYLLVNPVTDKDGNAQAAGPIGYTKAPQIPPALAVLTQFTEQDLKDLLGDQAAAEEVKSNVSGDALEIVSDRLDMQAFIYIDGHRKAVARAGAIWLGMARDLYVEEGRKVKTVTEQGETSSATLLDAERVDDNGKRYRNNDFRRAKFDVVAEAGPSSKSKRAATARGATALRSVTQDPTMGTALEHLALMNMEGEGLKDVREWSRKQLVQLGVIPPTDEEAKAMAEQQAAQPPTAQDSYLQAEAEKSQAIAAKTRADTALSMANTEKTQAQTEEIRAGIGRDDSAHVLEIGKTLHEASKPQPEPKPVVPGK